jgi:single-strand DNA-binding protein
MSEGLNRAQLMGNLGADPELRFTQSGTAVLNLRLATTTRFKDKDGTWQDRTEWHSVVVWGARAEALGKLLEKGSTVYVEGELRTSSYEKDGEKRYKTEVHADKVLLSGKASAQGSRDAAPRQVRSSEGDRARTTRGGGRDDRRRGRDVDDVPWG